MRLARGARERRMRSHKTSAPVAKIPPASQAHHKLLPVASLGVAVASADVGWLDGGPLGTAAPVSGALGAGGGGNGFVSLAGVVIGGAEGVGAGAASSASGVLAL